MILSGALVNGAAVAVAGLAGAFLRKAIPERFSETIMHGMALCVLYIGVSGSLKGESMLITILSLAVGAVIGELLNLDGQINRLGELLQRRLKTGGGSHVAKGFVTCSLLICVGAMAIVGAIESGLSANHATLYAKSLIDAISSFIMATTLGIGVVFAGALVFVYEGAMTLLAQLISPVLTEAVLNEISCVGSIIITGLALNMLGVTKIKVMNLVPAIFLPIILCMFI